MTATSCSGIVCIQNGCKRHSQVGELYCGEHGGPPEYVSDPGYFDVYPERRATLLLHKAGEAR